jgi:hypothetical protein
MSGPLSELFRPRIHPRIGKWIHLNTIVSEYGLNLNYLFDMLDLNGITYTHQEPRNLSRIYVSEEWLKLVLSGEGLARFCLLQTQVRDDELSEKHLNESRAHQRISPRKASPKQVRLLTRLVESKHLLEPELEMLNRVFENGWISKERASSLIEYLIGSSTILPDGNKFYDSDGILTRRDRQSRMKGNH